MIKKKKLFTINSKDFTKYVWKKKFRSGTVKDRLILYNEKRFNEIHTPSSLWEKKEIANRIGSQSRHGEVYKTHDNCALKIVPQSIISNHEREYLELFSQSVVGGECEHFPLLYASCCTNDIIFQNDKLVFEAFDNLSDKNIEICREYIETYINLISDENIKDKILNKLIGDITCDSIQSDIHLAWKLFKRYKNSQVVLNTPKGLMTNMFLVELANGDLISLFEKKKLGIEIKSILFGIFYGLYIMDIVYDCVHGDLHAGNILISQIPQCDKKYIVFDKLYELTNVKYLPILWDFETVRNKRYPEEVLKYDVPKILESLSYYNLPGIQVLNSKKYSNWIDLFNDVDNLS